MSDKYNDGVLDEKFGNVLEKMDDHFDATTGILKSLTDQVMKTNGSVRNLQLWRSYILGGMSVFMLFVIPIVGFLAYQVIKNGASISALEAHNAK
jgi:hypothetical protein